MLLRHIGRSADLYISRQGGCEACVIVGRLGLGADVIGWGLGSVDTGDSSRAEAFPREVEISGWSNMSFEKGPSSKPPGSALAWVAMLCVRRWLFRVVGEFRVTSSRFRMFPAEMAGVKLIVDCCLGFNTSTMARLRRIRRGNPKRTGH